MHLRWNLRFLLHIFVININCEYCNRLVSIIWSGESMDLFYFNWWRMYHATKMTLDKYFAYKCIYCISSKQMNAHIEWEISRSYSYLLVFDSIRQKSEFYCSSNPLTNVPKHQLQWAYINILKTIYIIFCFCLKLKYTPT